jgi:hypothetical protein
MAKTDSNILCMHSGSLLLPMTDGQRGGYNFIGNATVNFCDCNFLESHSNVSWLDLLALEAITRLVYCLCGNHNENCSPAGNLLGGFTDLW